MEGQRIIYVNGISTSLPMAFCNMQAVSNESRKEVVGIYNATDGNLNDVLQAIGDKWTVGSNPAVTTLKAEMIAAVNAEEERHFIGDSHGALIISRALAELHDSLVAQEMNEADIKASFGRFKIETFGGAAWQYPDGPQYVHYINDHDPVPFHFGLTAHGLTESERSQLEATLIEPDWMKRLTGVMNYLGVNYFAGREPGNDAKLVRFKHPSDNGWLGTHLTAVYLQYRKPFDSAYTGSSSVAAPFEFSPYGKIALRLALTAAGLFYGARMLKRGVTGLFKKKEDQLVETPLDSGKEEVSADLHRAEGCKGA